MLLLLFVPLSPRLPNLGLDDSWKYALNEVIAQHLVFGRDVIFTFGPLASAYTRMYHPATDTIMVRSCTFFAIALFVGCAALTQDRRKYLLFALPILEQSVALLDALFIFIPFIFLLLVTYWSLGKRSQSNENVAFFWFRWAGMVIVGTAVALLPLVKASFTGSVLACGGLALIIIARRSLPMALLSFSFAAGVMGSVWSAVGQPLSALPEFFLTQRPIISGYAEGMSMRGLGSEIAVYLVVALVIAWTFGSHIIARLGRGSALPVLGLALVLFICFKSGFIRHDGHALIAASGLLFASYLGLLLFRTRQMFAVMLLSITGWWFIAHHYAKTGPRDIARGITQNAVDSVQGLRDRVFAPGLYREKFERARAEMRREVPLPYAEDTVDLYSFDLSAIFANGQKWSPRPIFQSYSAYTPELLELNRRHLTAWPPPERIYLSVSPVDGHYPSMEDGVSWLELMSRYRTVAFLKQYAVLERRRSPATVHMGEILLERRDEKLSEQIHIPLLMSPIWAYIDITPTFVGRIASSLFKLPPLHMLVEYQDGTSAKFRFVPGMARSGFLLSPTVQTAEDYAVLTSTASSDVWRGRKPISIRILENRNTHLFWKAQYGVRIELIDLQPDQEIYSLLFNKLAVGPKHPLAAGGDCAIDQINRTPSTSRPIQVKTGILIQGWAAISGKDGVPNDRVFISLTSKTGRSMMAEAKKVSRADVSISFQQPSLGDSGYEARIDASDLGGKYQIHVIQESHGKYLQCGQTSATVIK